MLMNSQKYLAKGECVISDNRDIINVWCVEGK